MERDRRITGLWSYLRVVLVKPSWEFITTGVLMTVLYVGTWWRDNTLAREHIESYATQRLLPHWNPAWWICIGLMIALFLTVRESFRLFHETEHARMVLADAIPFPEIAIEAEYGLWVTNLSTTGTIFNVEIPPIKTSAEVLFRCVPENITSIPPGKTAFTDVEIVTPKEQFRNHKTYMIDIGKHTSEMHAPGSKELIQVAIIVVLCEDTNKNRFRFEFPLSYNPNSLNKLPRFCTGKVKRGRL